MVDLKSTVTIPDVVREYRVSDAFVRRAVREERIPATLVLGKYRLRREDVERLIQPSRPR